MVNIVKIGINGDMKDINIELLNIDLEVLEDLCHIKGHNKIKLIFKWSHENKNINLFSWTDGNYLNKHILPNNGEDIQYQGINSVDTKIYGDIIIIKTDILNNIENILSDEYGEFYNRFV